MTPPKKRYIRGLVFGVFDVFHAGHRHFLDRAGSLCETLVVAVTPDQTAVTLKGFAPEHSLETRMQAVRRHNTEWHVVVGDLELGSWHILERVRPDVVFIGYDQHSVAEALRERNIPVEWINAHAPDRYKSSLLRQPPQKV